MSTLSEKVNADFMAIFDAPAPKYTVAVYRVKYTHWDESTEEFLVETPYRVSRREMIEAAKESIGFYTSKARGKSIRLVTYH